MWQNCTRREKTKFYIAYAKGIPFWHKDKIEVDMWSTVKEVEEKVNLGEYLELSNKPLSSSTMLVKALTGKLMKVYLSLIVAACVVIL